MSKDWSKLIGRRVRVYDDGIKFTGTLVDVDQSAPLEDLLVQDRRGKNWYPHQQCRLLREKPKRVDVLFVNIADDPWKVHTASESEESAKLRANSDDAMETAVRFVRSSDERR